MKNNTCFQSSVDTEKKENTPMSHRFPHGGLRSYINVCRSGREGRASMWLAVLCVLCLLPGGPALPLPGEAGGHSESQWRQAQEYLKRFYPSNSKPRASNGIGAQLKQMQKFFRLPESGVLDSRIIVIMQKPRCGLPDVGGYSPSRNTPKWTSQVVTYRIGSYTRDIPRVTVNQLVAKAFNMWSKEIPLSFRRVTMGTADIMIGFARGAHGDFYPFDGPGGTLAHAFQPGPGLGGDAHFDQDEHWTDGKGIGVNFLVVATHELGHSLGLGHSSDPNSVMYPTYGVGDAENFELSPGDIREIQELYGNRSSSRRK
uniref:Matrix metallopeptidase 7 n=2 Tax=Suricata suricatta TaxID=37032 RepID=A0A673TXE8_SURSU